MKDKIDTVGKGFACKGHWLSSIRSTWASHICLIGHMFAYIKEKSLLADVGR